MPTNGSPGNADTLPDQIVPDPWTTLSRTARLESVINQPVQTDVRAFSRSQLLVPPIVITTAYAQNVTHLLDGKFQPVIHCE